LRQINVTGIWGCYRLVILSGFLFSVPLAVMVGGLCTPRHFGSRQ